MNTDDLISSSLAVKLRDHCRARPELGLTLTRHQAEQLAAVAAAELGVEPKKKKAAKKAAPKDAA